MMYCMICAQCYPHKLCITVNDVCMHPVGNGKEDFCFPPGSYKRIQISHLMHFLEVAHKVIHNMRNMYIFRSAMPGYQRRFPGAS